MPFRVIKNSHRLKRHQIRKQQRQEAARSSSSTGDSDSSMAEQNRNSISEEKTVKSPNVLERVKEEIEAMGHHGKSRSHHHKETHGTSDDIDQDTAVDDVKGPGFFERVKEEIEAVVNAVTPKHSPKK